MKSRGLYDDLVVSQSSSTRRTWIEIETDAASKTIASCRPPHGGRGLKFAFCAAVSALLVVVLHTEDVD